jgi:organic radical activating enzyme
MTAVIDRTVQQLRVIEQFATVQGEGPFTGRAATFLRLSGCNLSCSWCDTPYSWDWRRFDRQAETTYQGVTDVAAGLAGTRLLVVTGGEPLLQARGLDALMGWLPASIETVQYETNATRDPGPLAKDSRAYFVASPKLGNAGDPLPRRLIPERLDQFAALARHDRACLKVVVTCKEDVNMAVAMADRYGFPRRSIWILPEGRTADQHLATLAHVADHVVELGLNLSTRLHLLAWPATTRGR